MRRRRNGVYLRLRYDDEMVQLPALELNGPPRIRFLLSMTRLRPYMATSGSLQSTLARVGNGG